jgi:uncharacterized protein YyaL (SSP411 family)
LIQACIQLQEITGASAYLHKAASLTKYVMAQFADQKKDIFIIPD